MKRYLLPLAAMAMLGTTAAAQQQDTTRRDQRTDMRMDHKMDGAKGDPSVIAKVLAANEAEVNAADLALTKTMDEEIREFALMLRRDHSAMVEKLRGMAKSPNPTSGEDPEVREMRERLARDNGMLRQLDTAAFDSMFVKEMVLKHEKMLEMIDTEYLPKAQDQELRTLLQDAKPTIQEHLRRAKALKDDRMAIDMMMPRDTTRRDTTRVPPTRRPRL